MWVGNGNLKNVKFEFKCESDIKKNKNSCGMFLSMGVWDASKGQNVEQQRAGTGDSLSNWS